MTGVRSMSIGQEATLDVLLTADAPMTAGELAEARGVDLEVTQRHLQHLHAGGYVLPASDEGVQTWAPVRATEAPA